MNFLLQRAKYIKSLSEKFLRRNSSSNHLLLKSALVIYDHSHSKRSLTMACFVHNAYLMIHTLYFHNLIYRQNPPPTKKVRRVLANMFAIFPVLLLQKEIKTKTIELRLLQVQCGEFKETYSIKIICLF